MTLGTILYYCTARYWYRVEYVSEAARLGYARVFHKGKVYEVATGSLYFIEPLAMESQLVCRRSAYETEKHLQFAAFPPGITLYEYLSQRRAIIAAALNRPAFHIFYNTVLISIAESESTTSEELLDVSGVGPSKLEQYGNDFLYAIEQYKLLDIFALS